MEESGSFHGGDQGLRDESEGCGMEMLRHENQNLSGYQRSEKSIARSSLGLCLADWWWRRKGLVICMLIMM